MAQFKRYIAYALLILIFLLLLFAAHNLYVDHRIINEQTAIARVRRQCMNIFSASEQQDPYNIKAELFSCSEAAAQIPGSACNRFSPDVKVWIVSMDGLWFHYGPPSEDGSSGAPIQIHSCHALMDAKTGDIILLSSK